MYKRSSRLAVCRIIPPVVFNPTWLYVAALYALAVFIARKFEIDIPRRVALLFYVLVLVFFLKPMTQEFVNIPVDVLHTIPPWRDVTDGTSKNDVMNDVTLQHAIWAEQVRDSWKSLSAPLWNHLSGSGYPLLANGQSSGLSPIRFLALPLPLGYAMTAEAAIKILIALTFTFLFCRGRGLSPPASVLAAVAFGFSGYVFLWLHFPHVTTACFLPAVMYLIDRLVERPSFAAFTAAAVVWAFILFGGHPETAAHIFFLALVYVIWIVAVERAAPWRLFLMLGGALTVAALLSAPFLVPFAEALTHSQRYNALKDQGYLELPWTNVEAAIVLVQPHIYGRVPREVNWGWSTVDPMSGFAGVLAFGAWIGTFVGVARRREWRSREAFFAFAALLMFALFMGWPGFGEAIHFILPLMAHARLRFVFAFASALMAAFVVDRALRGDRVPLLSSVAAGAVSIGVAFAVAEFQQPAQLRSAIIAAIPSALVLVTALGLAFAAGRPRRNAIAVGALLVVTVIEIFSIGRGWSPPLHRALVYPTTPLLRQLLTLTAKIPENQPFRIAGIGPMFFPNTSAMYGLEDIRAHDPMAYSRYLGFLKLTAGYDPWEYFASLRDVNAPVFDFLNVRYVLAERHVPLPEGDRYAVVYDGPDGRILENRQAAPRFFAVRNVVLEERPELFYDRLGRHEEWRQTALIERLELETPEMKRDLFTPRPATAPAAQASIAHAEPTEFRLRVDAPRWSLVASSMPWWPGWKVERNGKRVDPIRVNGVFFGFAVPPGVSDVRVWYSPASWWLGVAMALLTIAGLVLAGIRQRRSSRRVSVSASVSS